MKWSGGSPAGFTWRSPAVALSWRWWRPSSSSSPCGACVTPQRPSRNARSVFVMSPSWRPTGSGRPMTIPRSPTCPTGSHRQPALPRRTSSDTRPGTCPVLLSLAFGVMEHAARASGEREGRFREVVELAADWIWETDDHAQITYLSDRVTQTTCFAKEDIFGHTPWDLPGVTFVGDWAEYRAAVERRERFEDFELNLS